MRTSEGVLAESKGSWSFCGHVGMLVRAGRDRCGTSSVKSFGNRNNLDPRIQDMPRGACSIPDALQNTKIGINAWEKAASQGCRATFPANCPEGLLQVPKSG